VGWREQRVGENESRFRVVNERLRDFVIDDAERHGEHPDSLSVLCECGDVDCTEKIDVSLTTYEWVRSASARFVIVPGHELPESERVVQQGRGYLIVEKFGDARTAASELDPRTN
jgi:hypothetical protein